MTTTMMTEELDSHRLIQAGHFATLCLTAWWRLMIDYVSFDPYEYIQHTIPLLTHTSMTEKWAGKQLTKAFDEFMNRAHRSYSIYLQE
jgi:hypothetical protein